MPQIIKKMIFIFIQTIKVQLRKKAVNCFKNDYSSYYLTSKNGKLSKYSFNYSGTTHSILEDNKENNYSLTNLVENNKTKKTKSNLTDLTLLKVRKLLEKIKPKTQYNNKTYIEKNNSTINKNSLRGEDIFRTTNIGNIRKN